MNLRLNLDIRRHSSAVLNHNATTRSTKKLEKPEFFEELRQPVIASRL